MTLREEYFFLKGVRHGLFAASELKDDKKITAAIIQIKKEIDSYRANPELGDTGERITTEADLLKL
jgi:hypothetical protein